MNKSGLYTNSGEKMKKMGTKSVPTSTKSKPVAKTVKKPKKSGY